MFRLLTLIHCAQGEQMIFLKLQIPACRQVSYKLFLIELFIFLIIYRNLLDHPVLCGFSDEAVFIIYILISKVPQNNGIFSVFVFARSDFMAPNFCDTSVSSVIYFTYCDIFIIKIIIFWSYVYLVVCYMFCDTT